MNTYQRIFGTGPRGLTISVLLLGVAVFFEQKIGLPTMTDWQILRYTVFGGLVGVTFMIVLHKRTIEMMEMDEV